MNYPTQTLATTTPVRASGAPRVAVVGAGIGGLSCARELALRGFEPVVFEASDRVGGRCSSLLTRVGWFDDGAQVINGNTLLSTYAAQEPGRLAASHVWTMPSAPVDAPSWRKAKPQDEDDPGDERELEWLGTVGVPSMRGLAEAIAKPLSVRLNTPIRQAYRHHAHWVLQGDSGDVDDTFQALVLAIPAPQALPLASGSRAVSKALSGVRYRNRWVLLLGSERAIHLPSYRVYGSGPIERIAAMHSKPGRASTVPHRWFIEASERWSQEHADDDAETVADLLLANFAAHARQPVVPHFLLAHNWPLAFADAPAPQADAPSFLWDESVRLGVCGDSVTPSRVDEVHRSGTRLATRLAESLTNPQPLGARAVQPEPASRTYAEVKAGLKAAPRARAQWMKAA